MLIAHGSSPAGKLALSFHFIHDSYFRQEHLKLHTNIIHEGCKDYKCESCGKQFARTGDLNRHFQSVHDSNKNYKCESCDKSFSLAGTLKSHIQGVHERILSNCEGQ